LIELLTKAREALASLFLERLPFDNFPQIQSPSCIYGREGHRKEEEKVEGIFYCFPSLPQKNLLIVAMDVTAIHLMK